MKSGRCPKCGSTEVAGPVELSLADQWARLVAFVIKPKGWFRSWSQETVQSWVCGDCGYLELYAQNPQDLMDKYRQWHSEN